MKQILIVEDDKSIAELERDYLEAADFEVTIAGDGRQGLELAQSGEYDLLLLDVMLPGVDGFQICREVRKTREIPILMVSADGRTSTRSVAWAWGPMIISSNPSAPANSRPVSKPICPVMNGCWPTAGNSHSKAFSAATWKSSRIHTGYIWLAKRYRLPIGNLSCCCSCPRIRASYSAKTVCLNASGDWMPPEIPRPSWSM